MKEEIEICQECGNDNLRYDPVRGEWGCQKCGLIAKDKELDLTGGIRQEHKGPKYSVGVTAYSGKLGSYMDSKNIDSRGNKISPLALSIIKRTRKWHYNTGSEERRITVAISKLHSLLRQLNTKKPVRIEADTILLKFLKKASTRVSNFNYLVAAVAYIAYKIKGVPKSIEEISKITSIKKKTINHYRKLLLDTLEIKIIPLGLLKYIPEISGKLNISGKSQILASQFLKKAQKNGLNIGKKPAGLVIAALYLACKQRDEKMTQRLLAKSANVTEVTLRTRIKELRQII